MKNNNYIVAAACLLLFACSNDSANSFRETLGLNRKCPDEFQVVARPPLSVPPDFNLVAPKQGADYVPAVSSEDKAHGEIVGTNVAQDVPVNGASAAPVPVVASGELPSSADSQFLADAGANQANPHIRQTIEEDNENGVMRASKKSDTLLQARPDGDPQVDPVAEAARLKQDKAQNLPPTTGDTPVIQPQTSIWSSIFR